MLNLRDSYSLECAIRILCRFLNHSYSKYSNPNFHPYWTILCLPSIPISPCITQSRWTQLLDSTKSMEYLSMWCRKDPILATYSPGTVIALTGRSKDKSLGVTKWRGWSSRAKLIWWFGLILCIIISGSTSKGSIVQSWRISTSILLVTLLIK